MASNRRAVRSIFFLHEVRLGRDMAMRNGQSATRISLVQCDDPKTRYAVDVEFGVAAFISDRQEKSEICIPWHMVRDIEFAPAPVAEAQKNEQTKPAKAPVMA